MSAITLKHGGATVAMLQSLIETPPRDFASFGVGADGRLVDPVSFYRVPATPTAQDRLCFDVSNNRIACSIDQRGLLERFVIQLGVAPIETRASPVGAYVEKSLARGGPMSLSISIGEAAPVALHQLPQPEIHLQDGLFPRFEWTIGTLRLTMLVFAPQAAPVRPRAVFTVFTLTSPGTHRAAQLIPSALRSSDSSSASPASMLLVGADRDWAGHETAQPIDLKHTPTTLAILLEATAEELLRTRKELSTRTAQEWFEATKVYHLERHGQLAIPGAPFYAELYLRASELTRQSLLLDGAGRFGGSFNGSDLPQAANVWMRDCFYSTLPQTFLDPDLARGAIPFFLDHGIPSHPLGEHADRFPGARGITNSLGNSVAGIVLAGMHYQHNDDRPFFLDRPEILTRSVSILNQVLASRREDVFLFPSIYVSDGESRGDFHTGSNIFLWRAFTSIARLADEVYAQPEAAALWRTCAQRLHEAILTNCIAVEQGGPRLVEGAMQDHTTIGGHDAEESDVTLAAFYGFCSIDDPAYRNAAHEAIAPSNPYAIAELEGIWWYAHAKWSSATFPGWTTALAGSQDEAETLRHLERIRTLTDADGSFWWWPYRHDAQLDLGRPLRTNSKCGWAAGVYVCLFTRHILGISVDAPSHTLAFRPRPPWDEFTWNSCRMGSMECDYSYKRTGRCIVLKVRNRTGHALQVSLQALLPEKSKLLQASVSPNAVAEVVPSRSHGRISAACSVEVRMGDQVTLSVEFATDQP
jgi:hypothetical protein